MVMLKWVKFALQPGLRPGSRWELTTLDPRPPSRMGRGDSLSIPGSLYPRRIRRLSLVAFGAMFILTPLIEQPWLCHCKRLTMCTSCTIILTLQEALIIKGVAAVFAEHNTAPSALCWTTDNSYRGTRDGAVCRAADKDKPGVGSAVVQWDPDPHLQRHATLIVINVTGRPPALSTLYIHLHRAYTAIHQQHIMWQQSPRCVFLCACDFILPLKALFLLLTDLVIHLLTQ